MREQLAAVQNGAQPIPAEITVNDLLLVIGQQQVEILVLRQQIEALRQQVPVNPKPNPADFVPDAAAELGC